MQRVRQLTRCKIPLTLITATLPPRLELVLEEEFSLPSCKRIRVPTDRKEHQYSVFRVKSEHLVNKTASFVQSLTALLDGTKRGIIFSRCKKQGEELKGFWPGVDIITGDVAGGDQMVEKWKTGKSGGWIIGTSCLIQGVDYQDVHVVIFMGSPWGMVDFVQGAGRSGRNGLESRVVVIDDGKSMIPPPNLEDMKCAREMSTWVANRTVCRRLGISQCMDDREVTCRELDGAALCDICGEEDTLENMFNKPPPSGQQLPNVLLTPLTDSGAEPPTQLEVADLRPQPARSDILRHSVELVKREKERGKVALECIMALEAFGQNCPVCYFNKKTFTGTRHKMCLNQGAENVAFYDCKKPSEVRG